MNEDALKLVIKHLDSIKLLITNSSLSSISIEFREDMKECARILGLSGYCFTCNSGLYNVVSRIYGMYLDYNNTINKSEEGKNSKTKVSRDRKC